MNNRWTINYFVTAQLQLSSRPVCSFILAKRYLLLFASFFLVLPAAHTQTTHSKNKEDYDVHSFRVKTIYLPVPATTFSLANIHSISVIDARADTARIGLMQKKVIGSVLTVLNDGTKNRSEQRVNKTPTFLQLQNGLKNATEKFTNTYLGCNPNLSLPRILMVIKKLWLTDELNLRDAAHLNENVSRQFNKDYWTSGADINIEFYLNDSSGYYPLYRYQQFITEMMTVSENGSSFLVQALQMSLSKMKIIDKSIAEIRIRHRFTLEEIKEHNYNNYKLPVLEDSTICPGVYLNFEEFKNNRPSHTTFNLQKDKRTDIVYLKQPGGEDYVARNIWGYCDGKNAYIKAGDNFFLLQRLSNAFYIFGAKNIKWEEGQSYPASASETNNAVAYALPVYYKSSKWELQLKPFQLDWSTGMLY